MNYLVTAIGSMSAAAVIASLRADPEIRVLVGCNTLPFAWTPQAPRVDVFEQVPHASDEVSYVASLLKMCASYRIDRVIPLTDLEVDALDRYRVEFEERSVLLCMPSGMALRVARDKRRLCQRFAGSAEIAVVPSVDLKAYVPALKFPLFAKPRRGRSSEGVCFIREEVDLLRFRQSVAEEDYVIQPYIDGEIVVVDVVRQQSTGFSFAIGRRELQRTPNGAGLVVEMGVRPDLVLAARHVTEVLDINGCVNVEFIVNEKGEGFLMDLNPRFSAGVAFSKMAGYDMVINHIRCFDGGILDAEVEVEPSVYCREYVEVECEPQGGSDVS